MENLVSLIPENTSVLVDIGADHGYLGITALKSKKVKEVWNVEISKSALENGKNNFIKNGLLEHAKFMLSNGLTNVPDLPKNSVIICAGIGSQNMIKIFCKNLPKNLNTIICMPHNHPIALRKWAVNNSWAIVDEIYCQYKKTIYITIKLQRFMSKKHSKSIDIFSELFGEKKFLIKNYEIAKIYWEKIKNKIIKKPSNKRFEWECKFLNLWEEFWENNKLIM